MTAAGPRQIAIIGIAARLPGASGPEETWRLLRDGVDAIRDRAGDRLAGPDRGGFVDGIDQFDADFFRMSPREAADTDPQQRLALELAWQGLEDAGIVARAPAQIGVFLGVMAADYADLVAMAGTRGVSRHTLTGVGRSMVANRVSHALRLAGPSLTVDAGQSSSLVAVHLACESLRSGEAEIALAGGVHLNVSPLSTAVVEAAGALSPDGRCYVFDERANGYVRGEGGGIVVLKPLERAVEDGDRVYAVIQGSAVGTGSDESGLTVPSATAQARTVAAALDSAGIAPADVQYVELHGTGTRVGDPIEAAALGSAYGRSRTAPLVVGSVKTNIGHLEGAAGIAGLIKTALCVDRREIVPSLNFARPNPRIPLDELGLRVGTSAEPWPVDRGPIAAGVTALGIGGTCCHLVLGAAPVREERTVPVSSAEPVVSAAPVVVPVVVSARGGVALRAQADRLRARLIARPELSLLDVGFSAAVTRAQLERRAVVVAGDRGALLTGLGALSAGEPAAGVVDGSVVGDRAVFVFPGQGAQWRGMAVGLLDSSPVFAAEMAACEKALSAYVGWGLVDVLRGAVGAPSLEQVDVVQPVLFAVMVSLARLWRSYGVEPAAVVGHSQGEIAAAYVAGGLSLDDAARVVALRSRLVRDRLAGRGGMVSVTLPVGQVEARIAGYGGRVSVAAVNGPASVVVSGEPVDLGDLVAGCERDGVRARRVPVDYASHSAQVEAIEAELRKVLAPITPRSGGVPFYSTVEGRVLDTAGLDAGYWYRNLRGRVGFEPAVRALVEIGANCFVEVSPHPVLTMAVEQTIEALDAADRVAVVGSLRRDEGGPQRFAASLAEAHVAGVPVDWTAFYAGTGARRVDLPTYAFQRQPYWLTPGNAAGDVAAAGLGRLDHPVLAAAVAVADRDEWLLTGRLSPAAQPWINDHAVHGTVVFPGAALVELALTAGRHTGCPVVDELVLEAPLVLADDSPAQLQVSVGAPDDSGRRAVAIYSRPETGEDGADGVPEATCHARGTLAADVEPAVPFPAAWPPAGAQPVPVEALYARLADAGYDYGPLFQSLRAAWRNGAEVYTEIAVPEGVDGFAIHPALLDGALHGGLLDKEAGSATDLPFSWSGVRVGPTTATRARVRIAPAGESTVRVDVVGEHGELIAGVAMLASRPVDPSQLDTARDGGQRSLFQVEWTPVAAGAGSTSLAVLGDLAAPGERYADVDALERALTDGALVPDAVVTTVESPGRGVAGAHATAERALGLLQRWLASEELAGARLVVVTRRGVAVGDEAVDLAVAPVWGLVRSAQSEHPGRFVLVDVDDSEPDWAGLAGADEPQLAVRDGRLLAPRLGRVPAEPAGGAWRLGIERKGSLEDLAILPSEGDRPLGTREVRIGVRAAGLNFRDVLIALGLYPGDAPLGSEAAGVVVEVGTEVADLVPGDRVLGLVPDAFGPVAVADRRMVVPMPAGWSFAQAAAVPVVYLTAYYGLVDLAGLARGERVLVHAAAGGVGMAAVQLARHLGAEVFATASPAKWDAVRDLGVPAERIASSRDVGFREKFQEATGGSGVDVVLNALAGEFIDASLGLLGSGGRFVEMGKADLRDPAVIAAEHDGVRYRSYDLFEAGPERIQQMLTEIAALFEAGVLAHAPIRTWDVRRGADAFRFLREGRNTGKIVLTLPTPLDPDGTVLITGGTSGLGALMARHLVERHGVRRLLLLSRRGPDAPGAQDLAAELEKLEAQVQVAACDVADRDQLAALIGSLEHPLTAVVHSAGVLDDGVIDSLTPERLERVLRPKVDAALHLHELTAGMELSAFVLFSSVAALIGSPGQGNYAAANATLDALAATRRATGQPATSLAWGLWADATGMTGELDEAALARLERQGIGALPSELGLELFDRARQVDAALLAPVLLDLGGLRAQSRAGMLPALLRGLVRTPARRSEAAGVSLAERLAGVPRGDWEQVTLDLVRGQVAAVLGHASPDAIERDRAFKELGFDSLAAVELRNRLTQATGLRLPTTLVFDHPSSVAIARFLIPIAVPTADGARPPSEEDEIRRVLASIPVARLRQAGLLDALVELANGDAEDTRSRDGAAVSIDDMDVEDLIRMTTQEGVA